VLEPNPAARLTAVVLVLIALACSFAGAALAVRTAPESWMSKVENQIRESANFANYR